MKKWLCLFLLIISAPSLANVTQLQFEHNGEIRTVTPSDTETTYINNPASVSFVLKVGLDRKLTASVKRGNAVLETVTTGLIGVSDKIEQDGDEFYGKKVTFHSLTNDGTYTLDVTVKDFFGDVAAQFSFSYVRDTVAPSIGNLSYTTYSPTSNLNGAWFLGPTLMGFAPTVIRASSINDNSGIDKVYAQSYTFSGNQRVPYQRVEIDYNVGQKTAEFNADTTPKPDYATLFPQGNNGTTKYSIQFIAVDKAGNEKANAVQDLYWDSYYDENLEVYGIYNPHSTNTLAGKYYRYDRYHKGMTVYSNPMYVLFRVPKSNHLNYAKGGIAPVGHIEEHVWGDHVYALFKLTHGNYNGNYTRYRSALRWASGYLRPEVVLHSSIRGTPVRAKSPEYHFSDIGWSNFHRWHIQDNQLPVTINYVRQQVEPRNYTQVFTHRGKSCSIPAWHTSCSIYLGNITLNRGTRGYLHDGSSLNSSDGVLIGNPEWADVSWNSASRPTVTSTSYNAEDKTLTAFVTQPNAGDYFDQLRLRSASVTDSGGNKFDAEELELVRANKYYYQFTWNLKTLPEGINNLYVEAEEMHGLKHRIFATQYDNDTIPPVLSMGYDGQPTFPEIVEDIRKIHFDVSDRFSTTAEIQLVGLGIDVQLGYSLVLEDEAYTRYTLELPKAFPTLEEDEYYDIHITVTDEYGNQSTISQTIRYIPENIFITDKQPYLPKDRALYLSNDKPLAKIYSQDVLLTAIGQIATGQQYAEIQLKTDAEFPITVSNGDRSIVVEPGMIRSIDFDLGEDGGKLELQIYPATEDVEGQADFLLFIPQLLNEE